jgi:hypothetical protein
MDKNTDELIKELWFQTYRSHAQYSVEFRQLPIDELLLVIQAFQPHYYSDIQRFLRQPFFLDSNSGIHLLKEIQQLDETRIRYESDTKDSRKRIDALIQNIKTNISEHNA